MLIAELDLAEPAKVKLRNKKIVSLEDLTKWSKSSIKIACYLSSDAVNTLSDALKAEGLEFLEEPPLPDLSNEVLREVPIEELQLSIRLYNSLKRLKINSVQDILDNGVENFKGRKTTTKTGMGEKQITELKETLQACKVPLS